MARTGRPREFDEEQALEKAMLLFWKKGYRNTSLTNLTDAMGMNRPSMYSVFGDKSSLFQAALQRYISDYASKNAEQLSAHEHIADAIAHDGT